MGNGRRVWTPEGDAQLTKLWNLTGSEKLSCDQIGKRLGRTKSMVVGRAHRLNLPKRPSPIIYKNGKPPGPKAARVHSSSKSLPQLTSLIAAAPPRPSPPPPRLSSGRVISCCWPIGQPGADDFRFCEIPSEPNGVYCTTHATLAYIRAHIRK
ncbi:MAG TPA: GcrA family cell cycle regulator [Candidatus Angelobacter sp.]|nr:GcrA family cell cycle regulator [Candidatus Angelobacter sp.]